jgi:hypothetical protein
MFFKLGSPMIPWNSDSQTLYRCLSSWAVQWSHGSLTVKPYRDVYQAGQYNDPMELWQPNTMDHCTAQLDKHLDRVWLSELHGIIALPSLINICIGFDCLSSMGSLHCPAW